MSGFASGSGGVVAGTIGHFACSTAPAGWLKANGAAVSRNAYAALFSAIGTAYGAGDGATTFNIPDLRGEFVRGWDDGRGVDAGRVLGVAQADDFKSHSHNVTQVLNGPGASQILFQAGSGGISAATGNSGGTETRPRNIAALACIKY